MLRIPRGQIITVFLVPLILLLVLSIFIAAILILATLFPLQATFYTQRHALSGQRCQIFLRWRSFCSWVRFAGCGEATDLLLPSVLLTNTITSATTTHTWQHLIHRVNTTLIFVSNSIRLVDAALAFWSDSSMEILGLVLSYLVVDRRCYLIWLGHICIIYIVSSFWVSISLFIFYLSGLHYIHFKDTCCI